MNMSGLGVETILLLLVWSVWLLAACEQLSFHRPRHLPVAWPVALRLEPSAKMKPAWPVRFSAVVAGLGLVLVPASLVSWRTFLMVMLAVQAIITAFVGSAGAGQTQSAMGRRRAPGLAARDQRRRLVLCSVSLAGVVWLVLQGGGTYWDYFLQVRLVPLIIVVVALIVYGQLLGLPELGRLARIWHRMRSAGAPGVEQAANASDGDAQNQADREEIRRLRELYQEEIRRLRQAHQEEIRRLGEAHQDQQQPVAGDSPEPSGPPSWNGAESDPQPVGERGETPPVRDQVSTSGGPQAGSAGTHWTWTYHLRGDRDIDAPSGGSPVWRGEWVQTASGGETPPNKTAARVREIRSKLEHVAKALPPDQDWTREVQLRLADEVTRDNPARWPLVFAATASDEDKRSTPGWVLVVERPPGPAGHGAGPQPGAGGTIFLLDAAAMDTLIVIFLGPVGSNGPNYGLTITVVKILIQPRRFVITAASMTIAALLNAHGLGALAPAFTRIMSKVLQAVLDYLLGPDSRYSKLEQALDLVGICLYAADGRPADSQKLRGLFADWCAGGPGQGVVHPE
jgi:hypothetical protein